MDAKYKTRKTIYNATYRRKHFPTKVSVGEPMKGTSGLGRKYELLALDLLKGSVDCNDKTFHNKWDIEWEGKKIEVKMRNFRDSQNPFHFKWKTKDEADYYLMFCVKSGQILKSLLIPQKVVSKFNGWRSISIGLKSRYDKYALPS